MTGYVRGTTTVSWYKTECATCTRSCADSAGEWVGVVYCCANVQDLVLASMGSFLRWITCIFDCCVDLMFDLVRLAIGSWLPLELAGTGVFLGIVIGSWGATSVAISPLSFCWPPLEMDGRTDVCLCNTGGLVIACLVLVPVFSNYQILFGQLQLPPIVNCRCCLVNIWVLLIGSVLYGLVCILPWPVGALGMCANIQLYL